MSVSTEHAPLRQPEWPGYETRLLHAFEISPESFYVKKRSPVDPELYNTAVRVVKNHDQHVNTSDPGLQENGMFSLLWTKEQSAMVQAGYMRRILEREEKQTVSSVYVTPLSGAGRFLDGLYTSGINKQRLVPHVMSSSSGGGTSGHIHAHSGLSEKALDPSVQLRVVEDVVDTASTVEHYVLQRLRKKGMIYDDSLEEAQRQNKALNMARVPYIDQRYVAIYQCVAEKMREADVVLWSMVNKNQSFTDLVRCQVNDILRVDSTNPWAREQKAALDAMIPMDPDIWIVGAGMFDMGIKGGQLLAQMDEKQADMYVSQGLGDMTFRLYGHVDAMYGFDPSGKNMNMYVSRIEDLVSKNFSL